MVFYRMDMLKLLSHQSDIVWLKHFRIKTLGWDGVIKGGTIVVEMSIYIIDPKTGEQNGSFVKL